MIALIVVAVVLVLLILFVIGIYNALVRLRCEPCRVSQSSSGETIVSDDALQRVPRPRRALPDEVQGWGRTCWPSILADSRLVPPGIPAKMTDRALPVLFSVDARHRLERDGPQDHQTLRVSGSRGRFAILFPARVVLQ